MSTPPSPAAASEGSVLALIAGADEGTALIEPLSGAITTYSQLHEAVERVACQLAADGVEPGHVVALVGPNDPAFLVGFFAIVALGAAAAPLNAAYTEAEFAGYLEDLAPSRVIVRDGAETQVREAAQRLGVRSLVLEGSAGPDTALAGVTALRQRPSGGPDSVALLLHTSGTTSRPKGVPLRQRNLFASARSVAATYGLSSEDVSHCVMPLFHVHGLIASVLAPLSSGGAVIVPPRFSAGSFWEHSSLHGMTWFSAVPTIHQILLTQGAALPDGLPLRFARSCSSALAPTTWRDCEAAYSVPLVEAYGMTEAAHQMASNPLPPGERRPGSVGRATGVDVAIVDDAWTQLDAGATGEVVVRGQSVVDAYRSNPEATAASFRDGWFRTGDLGELGSDGYLTLLGRIKELINRGGEKISPHEVEDALISHPAVLEAVAFPEPDAKYGESVGAAVVVKVDTEASALIAHCGEILVGFKVPSRIVVLDSIPKGPTGKVQRRRMADLLAP